MINPFFKNTGPHNINFLLKTINLKNTNLPDDQIIDIKDLNSSQKNENIKFSEWAPLVGKCSHAS